MFLNLKWSILASKFVKGGSVKITKRIFIPLKLNIDIWRVVVMELLFKIGCSSADEFAKCSSLAGQRSIRSNAGRGLHGKSSNVFLRSLKSC